MKTTQFSSRNVKDHFKYCKQQLDALLPEYDGLGKSVSVYFGGGTPSLFSPDYFSPLLDAISEHYTIAECTIETNPFMTKNSWLQDYVSMGITRATVGAQSLSEPVLQFLGRRHTADSVLNSVRELRGAGFSDVQVDLIYGLGAGNRSPSLHEEMTQLIAAGANGISTYALTIEENTAFGREPAKADEDSAVRDYHEICDAAQSLHLVQWETSNFGRKKPIHNSVYWEGLPYLGVGTGAHGLLPSSPSRPYGERYRVGDNVHQSPLGNHRIDFSAEPVLQKEGPRNARDVAADLMFTALRTHRGLELERVSRLLQSDFTSRVQRSQKVQRAVMEEAVFISEGRLTLSAKEKFRGDLWTLELVSLI